MVRVIEHLKKSIVAHPRAGQNYISEVLRKTGLQMGVGYRGNKTLPGPTTDGVVSFIHAPGFPQCFDVILHQTRDPLKTIASATTEGSRVYGLIFRTLRTQPLTEKFKPYYKDFRQAIKDSLALPMWTWLHLSNRFDEIAEWQYRIEDIDEVYPEICKRLGVKPLPKVPDVSRNLNRRPHRDASWKELYQTDKELAEQIEDKANKYGYK